MTTSTSASLGRVASVRDERHTGRKSGDDAYALNYESLTRVRFCGPVLTAGDREVGRGNGRPTACDEPVRRSGQHLYETLRHNDMDVRKQRAVATQSRRTHSQLQSLISESA